MPPTSPPVPPAPEPTPPGPDGRRPDAAGRGRVGLLARLAAGPVVCDGAMGTQLYARGVYLNRCYDEVNLTAPDLVEGVHRDYVRAGAEVLETNSFGANPVKLHKHGLADRTEEINRRAAEIARRAAGDAVLVVGAMGPLGIRMEPWGATSLGEAQASFARQARALAEAGVDGFCLETFGDLTEIHAAILACREVAPELPVIAQMTVDREGVGLFGARPEDFGRRLDAWGADVIGVNCSVGPQVMLGVLERLRTATSKPLAVQPNAGPPREVDGRTMFLCTPDYLEKSARRFLEAGARLLGGCCGTTPEHVRALAKAVKRGRAVDAGGGARAAGVVAAAPAAAPAGVEPAPLAGRSRLGRALVGPERPLLVELLPPKGRDVAPVLERAARLRTLGVTAINLPDGARAAAKMSPLAVAVRIQETTGVEAVLHVCCRDRNLLGLQADLLAASALGIRDVLLITGDPPILGDYPDATAVFDVDAIGLTNVATRLNRGLDLAGNPTGPSTGFVVGVGLNPTAVDLDREIERFRWKVDAGAEYAITQPVFDPDALFRFLDRLGPLPIPVLAGIWPLQSVRNAEFLATEVPGVTVPDGVLARLSAAGDAESQRRVGNDLAVEMALAVADRVRGWQLSLPFGRVDAAERFLAPLRAVHPTAGVAEEVRP
ncbi:MAG: bifunctional homocysteine S-methyltransferase/methylenetetrahydrofolate reductase [Planctomycetota bacterium]